ncbi:choice-of-anchor I family protein [Brevibacterium casei]|uniref:3-phytase (Myo-inositol-hexaphosphate 3-phosphohydrolase) n=1 Tax=Brevibacterium casei TaxID=33889 RepID=A0A449D9Y0_9MICO|nr:choice-of-anchor I family protein [Brevibacterium casei]MCT1550523.1 choice-of-anchor I family protein [Brevibacterium casei]MCT1560005.1 choice-of-anchor I family protein [Brevibacterium casei]MCT2208465.1 choice-of-anchor I family protein [Brevibacterium casei]VEW14367.1 3-phytase (myo-inositol-hexaphosphate 3-phosphohydrolase) [Brevibacterium casei]
MTTTKTVTAALTALLLTTGLSAGLNVTGGTPAQAGEVPEPITTSAPGAQVALGYLGAYETGQFDESAAEITAVHGNTVFTVNAQAASVDIIDASDPKNPAKVGEITGSGTANSIAIREDGLGVIALENEDKTKPGSLMFFDARTTSATVLGTVGVGSLPDMVTITPDGKQALVANEGEPAGDFSTDPEGSVSIVDLPAEVAAPTEADVRTADFREFEEGGSKTLPEGVRVFGPNPEGDLPVSRNLEPEYITVAGGKAYATLQEANAIAVVDIAAGEVERIMPLGFKDYGTAGNGLDPSDRDPKDAPMVNIATYPGLKGAYMPDTVSTFSAGGTDYLVTANEGDSREWGDFVDAARVKDLGGDGLAPVCETSPLADSLGDDELGRLNVITDLGLSEDGSCYEELYAFGGRSFSIWTTDGTLVADSGDEFEQMTAKAIPQFFNSNHTESNLEGRSDDKGPEPEALTIGQVGETTYAFVGFERIGGIAVYDLSDPQSPEFATYFNNRDFSVSVEDEIDGAADPAGLLSKAGDLGPEGITFLSAGESPTGEAALVIGNEVSGTTSLYSVADLTAGGGDSDAGADADGGAGAEADGGAGAEADGGVGADENAGAEADAGSRADADAGDGSDARASDDADAGTGADADTADSRGSGANDSDAKDSDPKGGSTGGASAGSEGSADADDENAGSLPRTGADLGQYLLIGGVAVALIALGVIAFLVTRRR